jgi:hypothetical protein
MHRNGDSAAKRREVIWERVGETYYAYVTDLSNEDQFHLGVEPLPRQRWLWTVLRHRDPLEKAAQGLADTAHDAMHFAELALAGKAPRMPFNIPIYRKFMFGSCLSRLKWFCRLRGPPRLP